MMTAQLAGTTEFADADFLDRATALGRVLFSLDLLAEATQRQREGRSLAGRLKFRNFRKHSGPRRCEHLEPVTFAEDPVAFKGKRITDHDLRFTVTPFKFRPA